MNVELYRTQSAPNKVQKTLKNRLTVENVRFVKNGTLDILNPSVLLNLTTDIEDIKIYNYMRIPKFDRYYFIDGISTEGGLIRIDGKVDVLMSHSKDILNSTQYILRNEQLRSPYLVDSQIPIRSDKRYHQVVFGNPVDNKQCAHIILETTGKGGTVV